ncbi:fructose PTS transporter subunit IIA [Tepidibacillus marianensis]|uniref:PTS sugar transporter subunit IIA n=1 Tax=Tepidibacillus marianensis TaxID=3131995 RepID=UPI0030D5C9FE
MELSTLIKEETIALSLDASNKKEAITKLANIMTNAGYISEINVFTEAVLTREEKGSTGIGFQVAIPHGKTKGVSKPGLAFATLAHPIDWDSLDGKPVSMFFLIAVPEEQAGNEHLQILAALSRKLIHEEFRNQLMSAKTVQEVLDLIKTAA